MEYIVKNQTFDEERALYGSDGITVEECKFDGPADGESALKECRNVKVSGSFFNLRYPLWHNDGLVIDDSEMTDSCRAVLWYANNVTITNTKLHGIKALRERSNVRIEDSDIISPEFGWSVNDIVMKDTSAQSEYFMMRSDRLQFNNVRLNGKYSFQYISDSVFEDCTFDTKDAFWHARNVLVKNCIVKGEYLAWYCENVTFENCTIIGTQPLIDCKMLETDLAFEKSEVEASISTSMISIKNPSSGTITAPEVGEIIMDDASAKGRIIINP